VIDQVPCWLHPPLLTSEVAGRNATLSWSIPSQAAEVYVNVTTNPAPSLGAGFEQVNVANDKVTGTYS